MRYEPVSSQLFIENRKKLINKIKPNSIVFVAGNVHMPDSADAFHPWRQHPDLFYLTGIEQEETFLFLFPDCPAAELREVLFIRQPNELLETWEGRKLTRQQASEMSGISEIRWSSDAFAVLFSMMHLAENVYLNTNEHDRASLEVLSNEYIVAEKIKKKFPLHHYERLAPVMGELRVQKSALEIELMKKAIDITAKAFHRILKFVSPGVWEYEVEAEITHEYLRNRATRHAYEPIIASGENACFLHYNVNNARCNYGDLLLIDTGAEYANYCADLTRTIPVNGRFTKRQKEIYCSVLNVLRGAVTLMRPGISIYELNQQVAEMMERELVQLNLISLSDLKKQDKEKPLYKKYFPHGIGHYLGLNTHDVGSRYAKIPEGAVLTCEPGIYIREEKIGIRLENNILVTKDGPVDLTADIPLEPEEIEELMQQR
ncbi:MAG: aminopeptidase P family protein [Chitinophagales bacterium]|nr:aminopeptidase P family protein [Chitinophagales bacterium]MDW8272702.1 aminopeptidase P family protein [Chitinophagales bacterium]